MPIFVENINIHHIANIFILFMLLVTSCGVAFSRNLLTSTLYLAIFSLLMALLYVILQAPDVAITEAAIGAGVSTVFLLGALILTGESEAPKQMRGVVYIFFAVTAVAITSIITDLPDWGSATAPANIHVAPYYIQNTESEIGVPNIVTAVLASYRGFDTLGEVFVVFTAAISVYALLYGRITRKN